MQLHYLSLLALGISRVLAIPATLPAILGEGRDQSAGFLSPISSNVKPRASPMAPHRPPTPFVYRIRQEPGNYINFTSYGREIPRQDGDMVM